MMRDMGEELGIWALQVEIIKIQMDFETDLLFSLFATWKVVLGS